MSGVIHLITEDETDIEVVRAILQAKAIGVRINPLRPSKPGGISRLAAYLERLIQTAIRIRQENDCIAVLHDADDHTERNRSKYDDIAQICQSYRKDVVLVTAHDEIEAWLLADSGVCNWLEIKPQQSDEIARPSEQLNRYVKKVTRKDFTGSNRKRVLDKVNGTGELYNHSLKEALTHLNEAPCLR